MRLVRLLFTLTLIATVSALSVQAAGAVESGNGAFSGTWSRTDQPVAESEVSRTWMWGPAAFTSTMMEPYLEGNDGARVVQYYDKTRMEITTDPEVDPESIWYVTNGLLAFELVTGQMQLGNEEFQAHEPAQVNAAGDAQDSNAPTYASFSGLLDAGPVEVGAPVTQRISRDGSVSADTALESYGVTAAYFVPETNHAVASPFWEFMNSEGMVWQDGEYVTGRLFEDPFFATGFPITEAYWADVLVDGEQMLVLIQVFERRVLTYTPNNPDGWKVEAGNVGAHYYQWRYNAELPSEPPAVEGTDHTRIGPVLMPDWPVDRDGQALYAFGNQSPYAMTVTIDGPTAETFTLDPCEDCPVYESRSEVTTCRTDIDWHEVTLPPGNYQFRISWDGGTQPPLAGPHTLVPDALYASCYFVVESRG